MASRSRVAVTAEPVEAEETYEDTPVDVQKPARSSRVVRSGWGNSQPQTERRETVKAPYLVLRNNGRRIIKILDEVPPVHYFQHFVNSKRLSYTCGQIRDDNNKLIQRCPLCDAGHRAGAKFMMNVVDMADPKTVVKWDFGNEVKSVLLGYTENGPLNDINRYFEVYHVAVAGRTAPSTKVDRLKARDFEEDHNGVPLTEAEIEELCGPDGEKLYGEEVVWVSTVAQLQEIADGLLPGDFQKKKDS